MNEKSTGHAGHGCAACKHQRKKCKKGCPLAQYFPAKLYQDFVNVHKLYGVANIVRILRNIEPYQRKAAAQSIMFEAEARRVDPVLGSFGLVHKLISQIDAYKKELHIINQQLSYYRQQEESQKLQQLRWFQIASSSSLPINAYNGGSMENFGDDQTANAYTSFILQEFEDIKPPFDFNSSDQEINVYFNNMPPANNNVQVFR
ncbi:PREDICTED: LOB domain-containing protein 25-like [Nelumbo nucifera]|uniref:LOB domain-containing protein 25-like n=1 Tax=Nelumbo nucifera TaxID=4432 RepID=A0A1U7Z608_NELNU|nr:PREDICTED: LOB domain-containing protein 25-like [Nelumbo nucifera]